MTISLRLPEDVHAKVRRVADQEDRTVTAQILRFIRAGLEQYREEEQESERPE